MRLRTEAKLILLTTVVVFGLAVLCSCSERYSDNFVETCYVVDTYEANELFTPESTLLVSFTEPKEGTEGLISCCDKIDARIYFVFNNMNTKIEDVKFNNIANHQPLFDVKVNGSYSSYICLNSYDWSKGFNVNATKINFIAQS